MTVPILICILLATVISKQLHLDYNHAHKTIQLYDLNQRPYNFQLNLTSTSIKFTSGLTSIDLFLGKHSKLKIEKGNDLVKYDYKVKQTITEQSDLQISGSIGLNYGNDFFSILKKVMNQTQIKLQVKHKEGQINVISQKCNFPQFAPYSITLSQTKTHSYNIPALSTNFIPDSTFLQIINQTKSPFQISEKELNREISISVKNRIISVPIRELINCGKYAGSQLYECEIKLSRDVDVGGLLFNFDPVLCINGMQLELVSHSWLSYQNCHLILMVLQFCLLVCLVREQSILKFVNRLTGFKQH